MKTPERKTREQIAAELGTDKWIYIAIGLNVWGKGFTIDQARDGGNIKVRDKHLVYAVADPWAVITEMGDIEYRPRPDGSASVANPKEYTEVYRHEPKTKKRVSR